MASKRGRKSVNPEVKEKALQMLKDGKTIKEVAEASNVSVSSVMNWKGGGAAKARKKSSVVDELQLLKWEVEFLRKKVMFLEGK